MYWLPLYSVLVPKLVLAAQGTDNGIGLGFSTISFNKRENIMLRSEVRLNIARGSECLRRARRKVHIEIFIRLKWLQFATDRDSKTAANAQGFVLYSILLSTILLATVPDSSQNLPFDINGFRTLRNALSIIVFLTVALLAVSNFFRILKSPDTCGGLNRFLLFLPAAIWIGILVDFFLRSNDNAPNKVILLGILLIGLSFFMLKPVQPSLPRTAPALLILALIIGNWVYQLYVGISYLSGPDMRFAWFVALILPWLIPQQMHKLTWPLFGLNHFVAWVGYLFLLQTQLRSPSLVALMVVVVQTFFWAVRLVDRVFLALLQAAIGVLSWSKVLERDIIRDGRIFDTGRSERIWAPLRADSEGFLGLHLGNGLGHAQHFTKESVGISPHNIWLELYTDFGVLSVLALVLCIFLLVYSDKKRETNGDALPLIIFRAFYVACFAILGFFNSILDETIVVFSLIIVLFGAVGGSRTQSELSGGRPTRLGGVL